MNAPAAAAAPNRLCYLEVGAELVVPRLPRLRELALVRSARSTLCASASRVPRGTVADWEDPTPIVCALILIYCMHAEFKLKAIG